MFWIFETFGALGANCNINPTCSSHYQQVLRKLSNSFLVTRVETAINVARSMRLLERMQQKNLEDDTSLLFA